MEFIAKSKIWHCPKSSRVYLMDLHPADFPHIIDYIDRLAADNNYTKLFVKVGAPYVTSFICNNYSIEAVIPGFYNGIDDAFFMVKYFDNNRAKPEIEQLAVFSKIFVNPPSLKNINNGFTNIIELDHTYIDKIIWVFKQVFESYPFPIFDAQFIYNSMKTDGTKYFGAFYNNNLIAVSSAECCLKYKNAEMTDFAVLPQYRGKGIAYSLLLSMQNILKSLGYKTFYTIARLHSIPMNKTFYNLGYKYSGTLTNNTHIAGKIESMNVWYKTV